MGNNNVACQTGLNCLVFSVVHSSDALFFFRERRHSAVCLGKTHSVPSGSVGCLLVASGVGILPVDLSLDSY